MIDCENFPSLEEALKEKKITSKTYERVKIARGYIEKKYKMKKIQEEEKKKDWELITQKLNELKVSDKEADNIKKAIQHKEAEYSRIKRQKMTIREFKPLAIVGKGAFGEVRICRHIQNNEIYAIKKMKKEEMHTKNQILHIRAERDVLSEANNQWIVDLKYSFQDEDFLYLVMEYLPGGDLMTLLMTKDILPEDEARFYVAELVLAIESVHKLKCIHRDLKPDNILICKDGHIKLSDFGLSKKTDLNLYENEENLNNINENELQKLISKEGNMTKSRKKRIFAYSTVGTPDYIAPEVFTMKGYGPQIDWWSLGVILFEMLIGYAPFSSENPTITCKKILNYKQFLHFPNEIPLSHDAMDLIKKLITDLDNRLGYNGAEDIKSHPFFQKIEWDNIKSLKPPFIPDVIIHNKKIENDCDTKYFDSFPEVDSFYPEVKSNPKKNNKVLKDYIKDLCFVDFSYKRGMDQKKTSIVSALEVLESIKISLNKTEANEELNHLRQISAINNLKETDRYIRSSIIDPNLESSQKKEIIEESEKEAPIKELIKSQSIDRDIIGERKIEFDKKIATATVTLLQSNQKLGINKSNSSKIHFDKPKNSLFLNKESSNNNNLQNTIKCSIDKNNNLVNNIYSPKAIKNSQIVNANKNNNHQNKIINNYKLNKNKESITYEEKKMGDKRNYESTSNDKVSKNNMEKKIIQTNSNVNLISNNNAQFYSEKINDYKLKNTSQIKQKNIINNQLSNKTNCFINLNVQKVNSSHKEDEKFYKNEEIIIGNANKTNLNDKGAVKKPVNKQLQNHQYISTNYVKDFINSESNHLTDLKANKISSNNSQKIQNKNNNSSYIVYSNVSVNSTISGTRPVSTKNTGPITNSLNPNIKISTPTASGLKIKALDKLNHEKEKINISPTTPTITSVKGFKIDVAQGLKVNNDFKGKK